MLNNKLVELQHREAYNYNVKTLKRPERRCGTPMNFIPFYQKRKVRSYRQSLRASCNGETHEAYVRL